jgi:hypothetical protein
MDVFLSNLGIYGMFNKIRGMIVIEMWLFLICLYDEAGFGGGRIGEYIWSEWMKWELILNHKI